MILCRIYFTDWIHSFSLFCTSWGRWSQNQISKTNQPYDVQSCWLLLFFFLPSFYWHFSLLPSFPPEVAAFSPRGSLWTGPDVPGSTLPHSLPHGIFMGNQAPQHSTAPRRTDQRPLIYLFISSPCCLAVWCTTTVQHTRASSHLPVSVSHSPHPFSFIVFLFIGTVPLDT